MNKIKKLREKLKMSRKTLAQLSGISQSFIYVIEEDKSFVSLKTYRKIAEVLKVHIFNILPDDWSGVSAKRSDWGKPV